MATSLTQMNELDERQQHAIEEYLREFIDISNDGRVFTFDTSTLDRELESVRTDLTTEEIRERGLWAMARRGLEQNYPATSAWKDLSVNDLLQLSVAPPLLDLSGSSRAKPDTKQERLYPNTLYAWVDFEKEVYSFTVPAVEKGRKVDDVLYHSVHAGKILRDEDGERTFVVNYVLEPLQKAGLLEHGTTNEGELLEHDHFLIAGVNKTVPIVFKATHNLLVPEKAVDITHRYKKAAVEVKAAKKRSIDWNNIRNPVGQLIKCMIDARSRYGLLSSGTRTYFFKVEFADDGPRVFITDAWFVGQKNCLRAWACFYDLAKHDSDFHPPVGWEKSLMTETLVNSSNQDVQFMTWLEPDVAPSIPRVDGEGIEVLQIIGMGRHLAYLAHWKGDKIVLKLFDACKDLARFEKEIRAYEHLKDAWGVLVPEPYFICDYRGFEALGMQLGRSPSSSDSDVGKQMRLLFHSLRRDYGFDHWSPALRNVIYIPDKSGTGMERLVAIDLERHQILR